MTNELVTKIRPVVRSLPELGFSWEVVVFGDVVASGKAITKVVAAENAAAAIAQLGLSQMAAR